MTVTAAHDQIEDDDGDDPHQGRHRRDHGQTPDRWGLTLILGHADSSLGLGSIATLLVIWVVLIVLGAVLHGLFWLLIIGAVLFVGTAVLGWVKREALGHRR